LQRIFNAYYFIFIDHFGINNSQEDILPLAPVDIGCCLTTYEREQLREIPLQKPLNILSSVEHFKIASRKIDEIQELINAEQAKQHEYFKIQRLGELL
jgi:hypothetical protein